MARLNNKPTPETDSIVAALKNKAATDIECRDTMTGLSMRLERERDEAREQRDSLAAEYGRSLAEIMDERAEAREQRDNAVDDYETAALLASRMQEQRDRLVEALRTSYKEHTEVHGFLTTRIANGENVNHWLQQTNFVISLIDDALAAVEGGKP